MCFPGKDVRLRVETTTKMSYIKELLGAALQLPPSEMLLHWGSRVLEPSEDNVSIGMLPKTQCVALTMGYPPQVNWSYEGIIVVSDDAYFLSRCWRDLAVGVKERMLGALSFDSRVSKLHFTDFDGADVELALKFFAPLDRITSYTFRGCCFTTKVLGSILAEVQAKEVALVDHAFIAEEMPLLRTTLRAFPSWQSSFLWAGQMFAEEADDPAMKYVSLFLSRYSADPYFGYIHVCADVAYSHENWTQLTCGEKEALLLTLSVDPHVLKV